MAQEIVSSAREPAAAIPVHGPGDVRQACEQAKRMADAIGFPKSHCEDIGLVATELGTNLLRHASHGRMRLAPIEDHGRKGIQIETEDDGPGIGDLEQAIVDGYSTAGGLGLGLGTVNRLMDDLEVHSSPGGGLHLVCQRWVRPPSGADWGQRLAFGAATRPCRGFKDNGDTFLIKRWERHALVGVIDGLGHGQFAERAAQSARQYVEAHFDQPLDKLFRGAGRACRATRGVVMALARFNLEKKRLAVASVGNVETRLVGADQRLNLVVRRGIVGLNAPEAVVYETAWPENGWLVLHSDGVSTHWDWSRFRDMAHQPPGAIAQRMLVEMGKPEDDATVVVAGSTPA